MDGRVKARERQDLRREQRPARKQTFARGLSLQAVQPLAIAPSIGSVDQPVKDTPEHAPRLINNGVDLRGEVAYNRTLYTRVCIPRTHLHGTTPPHPESQFAPEELIVRQGGRIHHLKYYRGDTLLETLRREGVWAPSNCEQGVCGTCMVKRVKGTVVLRQNYVLSDQDLAAGFTLACQGVPCDTVCEIEIEG